MIPEPMTAMISRPVPRASATRRRARSSCSAPVPVSGCGGELGHAARPVARARDALVEFVDGARRTRRRCRSATGSGMDQCSQLVVGVELLVGAVADRDDQAGDRRRRRGVGVAVGTGRGRPVWRRRRRRDGPVRRGGCRRDSPGAPVSSCHSAAASWERAELCGADEQRRPGVDRVGRATRSSRRLATRWT